MAPKIPASLPTPRGKNSSVASLTRPVAAICGARAKVPFGPFDQIAPAVSDRAFRDANKLRPTPADPPVLQRPD